ncbi:hypothetical protein NLI96_g469 [Meripilus lineatus]|uniref:Methyltransferase n=1 Tax=Meripilus lineatus TaxID=2056292 RepID=A0AAD5VCB3_9APHY|nr:hypothetical protein NLI96_g469 [Physisporinus lineatus]
MISYLEHSSEFIFDPPFLQPPDFPPHHILELGSGTGIVASRLVQHIRHAQGFFTVTDLPEVCPLLERNLTNYIQGSPSRTTLLVRPLAWGNKAHALAIYEELLSSSSKKFGTAPILSHIICSDLVYFPELLAPLLRSLLHLTSPPFTTGTTNPPTVIISYKIRSLAKETAFWSTFGLWFTFEPVLERQRLRNTPLSGGDFRNLPSQTPDPDAQRPLSPQPVGEEEEADWQRFGSDLDEEMFIFIARRRPESNLWEIPDRDEDLLNGVGAGGTQACKSDDTFESLLLLMVGGTN